MTTLPDPSLRSRPRGLLLASVLCILVGWGGVLGGYREISFYSAEFVAEPPLIAGSDTREQEAVSAFARAERQARDRVRRTRLPLAVANMLLSGLLVFGATRAFAGRPGARSLALQALGANALLAVVDYTLSGGLRGELAPALSQLMRSLMKQTPPAISEAELLGTLGSAVWYGFRLQLAATLAVYGVAWAALSTPAARAFLSLDDDSDDDE